MNIKFDFNISLGVILTIIFVVLKLTNFISWSWLWVLSPLWISFIICVIIIVIANIWLKWRW